MAIITRSISTSSIGKRIDRTHVALWVTQSALALIFLFAGASKLVMSAEQMSTNASFDFPLAFMRFIGVCEVAGALGLILPSVSRIRPGLTPLAASGLVIIMVGATVTTVIVGPAGMVVVPFAVGLGAAFVAYGRTHLSPIGRK
jgi:hypothetical protein